MIFQKATDHCGARDESLYEQRIGEISSSNKDNFGRKAPQPNHVAKVHVLRHDGKSMLDGVGPEIDVAGCL